MRNRLLHYTSEENWQRIQRERVLSPLSNPNSLDLVFPYTLEDISENLPNWNEFLKDRRYLVGVFPKDLAIWQMPLVNGQTSLDLCVEQSPQVCLEVPILDEKGFVRDVRYFTEELLFENPQNIQEANQRAIMKYFRSTLPLNKYKGDYVLPEVWVSQEVPFELLRRLN